jgi:predicted nucleic acid-binding protein
VLYPSTLRDVLIRLAQTGLLQAKWSETILDETFRSLHAKRPDLDEARLQRTRELMNLAVRDPVVTGYEPLIGSLHLPDPDDRHVLATAIRARAQIIVTFNLNDFPAEVLADWDVEARHPDDFLVDQFHLDAACTRPSRPLPTPGRDRRARSTTYWIAWIVPDSPRPRPSCADNKAERACTDGVPVAWLCKS